MPLASTCDHPSAVVYVRRTFEWARDERDRCARFFSDARVSWVYPAQPDGHWAWTVCRDCAARQSQLAGLPAS